MGKVGRTAAHGRSPDTATCNARKCVGRCLVGGWRRGGGGWAEWGGCCPGLSGF